MHIENIMLRSLVSILVLAGENLKFADLQGGRDGARISPDVVLVVAVVSRSVSLAQAGGGKPGSSLVQCHDDEGKNTRHIPS